MFSRAEFLRESSGIKKRQQQVASVFYLISSKHLAENGMNKF